VDAIELLTEDHQKGERAFKEFESTDDTERRKQLARQVITDLSVHAGIEEVAFYPSVKEALPSTADDIDEDLGEHAEAKELLSQLQGMDPSAPEFEPTFRELMADVRHHVDEEEGELFAQVREAFTAEELRDLGQAMQDVKGKVPSNPHPHAPQEPPANVTLGPVAGVLDRIRDAVRERVGKDSV
jgi:hemerythrin superfamily protein